MILRKAFLANFLGNFFFYSKYKLIICRSFFVLVCLDFSWHLMPRTSDWKAETEEDLLHLSSMLIFSLSLSHIEFSDQETRRGECRTGQEHFPLAIHIFDKWLWGRT